MPRTRPPHPPELRERMVELVRSGRSAAELAQEFEPREDSIRNRVRQADLDERRRDDGLTTDEKEETACDEALDRILREYAKLCEHGITDEELDQAKSHAKGRSILAMESTGPQRQRRMVALTESGARHHHQPVGRRGE